MVQSPKISSTNLGIWDIYPSKILVNWDDEIPIYGKIKNWWQPNHQAEWEFKGHLWSQVLPSPPPTPPPSLPPAPLLSASRSVAAQPPRPLGTSADPDPEPVGKPGESVQKMGNNFGILSKQLEKLWDDWDCYTVFRTNMDKLEKNSAFPRPKIWCLLRFQEKLFKQYFIWLGYTLKIGVFVKNESKIIHDWSMSSISPVAWNPEKWLELECQWRVIAMVAPATIFNLQIWFPSVGGVKGAWGFQSNRMKKTHWFHYQHRGRNSSTSSTSSSCEHGWQKAGREAKLETSKFYAIFLYPFIIVEWDGYGIQHKKEPIQSIVWISSPVHSRVDQQINKSWRAHLESWKARWR